MQKIEEIKDKRKFRFKKKKKMFGEEIILVPIYSMTSTYEWMNACEWDMWWQQI